MNLAPIPAYPAFWLMVRRSLLGACPCCGKGRLFSGYLKQVEECAVCSEPFGSIRADDGPAWLTVIVVGHLLAPVLLTFVPGSSWPEWVSMIFWPVIALLLSLLLLPRAKGLFIAMIWRTQLMKASPKE